MSVEHEHLPDFMTRHRLRQWLNDEYGIPLGKSTLDKLCADGEGPPIDAWWNKRPLHKPQTGLDWALARLRRPHQDDDAA